VLVSSPLLILDGQSIKNSSSTKFLGVTLDECLEYKEQCLNLRNKLNSVPFMFVVLRRTIRNVALLKTVYYANVQSHLQFGIICWGNSVAISQVFTVQKKIIRALLGFRYKRSNLPLAPCKSLFIQLELLTLPSLFILECAKFFRKHPQYFTLNTEIHTYNTRRKNDISIHNNTKQTKSPTSNVARVYNKLPRVIKEIKAYQPFVKTLKKFLVEKCYYNVDDFHNEIWQS